MTEYSYALDTDQLPFNYAQYLFTKTSFSIVSGGTKYEGTNFRYDERLRRLRCTAHIWEYDIVFSPDMSCIETGVCVQRPQSGVPFDMYAYTGTSNLSRKELHYVRRQLTKIVLAVESMVMFLNHVMSSRDRCSVVSFNNVITNLVTLGDERSSLQALVACQTRCAKTTRLWDAIKISISEFVSRADRSRPWVAIVLTDGDDCGSEATLEQSAQVCKLFNASSNNFTIVVGLGAEVNTAKLNEFCDKSDSMYRPARSNLGQLQEIFALIALQVTNGVAVDYASFAGSVFARVRETTRLSRGDIDILLILDISSSMNSL